MNYEKRKAFIVNCVYAGLIACICYVVLRYGLGLLAPFLLAALFAYMLNIPADFLCRKTGLPYKPTAFLLVLLFYSTIGLLLSLAGIKLVGSAMDLFSALPSFYASAIEPTLGIAFNHIEALAFKMDPALMSILNDLFSQFVQSMGDLVTSWSVMAVSALSGYASSLPSIFIKLLLMVISTFFIAGDYPLLADFVSRQLPERVNAILAQIRVYVVGTLWVCIRSYALIMCITCLELSVGLSILRISNAVPIALCISIFDILPVLGTGGIMLPWVVITAVRGEYSLALGLLAVYLVVTVIRNILEPKIVGSQIRLHPVVTLASMFVGVQLFGVLGLFGLPILLSLLRHLNDNGTIRLFR